MAMNVVVTCTKRKSCPVPRSLAMRSIPGRSLKDRLTEWTTRLLHESHQKKVRVSDLYSGDHWAVARSIAELDRVDGKRACRLWVASAGYGLLSIDDDVLPYAATFSASHADDVARTGSSVQRASDYVQWWQGMAKWRQRQVSGPASMTALAKRWPEDSLIIVASKPYLTAMMPDLLAARGELAAPDLLTIFSAGAGALSEIAPHVLSYDARLQQVAGGALRSLNIRVARMLLRECRQESPKSGDFQRLVTNAQTGLTRTVRVTGRKLDDAEVRHFISRELRTRPEVSCGRLLRVLRDGGSACEQKRFKSLFAGIRSSLNGR